MIRSSALWQPGQTVNAGRDESCMRPAQTRGQPVTATSPGERQITSRWKMPAGTPSPQVCDYQKALIAFAVDIAHPDRVHEGEPPWTQHHLRPGLARSRA